MRSFSPLYWGNNPEFWRINHKSVLNGASIWTKFRGVPDQNWNLDQNLLSLRMLNVLSQKHPVPAFTPDQLAGYEFGRDLALDYRDGEVILPELDGLADLLESTGFSRCTVVGETERGTQVVVPLAFSRGDHVVAIEMFVGPTKWLLSELSPHHLRFKLRDTLKNRYFLRAASLKALFNKSGILFAAYLRTEDDLIRLL